MIVQLLQSKLTAANFDSVKLSLQQFLGWRQAIDPSEVSTGLIDTIDWLSINEKEVDHFVTYIESRNGASDAIRALDALLAVMTTAGSDKQSSINKAILSSKKFLEKNKLSAEQPINDALKQHFSKLTPPAQRKCFTGCRHFLHASGHACRTQQCLERFPWHQVTPEMADKFMHFLATNYQQKTIALYVSTVKSLLRSLHNCANTKSSKHALMLTIERLGLLQKKTRSQLTPVISKPLDKAVVNWLSEPPIDYPSAHDLRDLAYFSLQMHSGLTIAVCRQLVIGVKDKMDDALLSSCLGHVDYRTRGGSLVHVELHSTTRRMLTQWMKCRGSDPGYVIVPLPLPKKSKADQLRYTRLSYQSAKTLFKNFCKRHDFNASITATQLATTYKAMFK